MKTYAWLILIVLFATLYLIYRGQYLIANNCRNQMFDKQSIGSSGKTALLIHGYPEPIYENSALYKYFKDRGYTVIAPYLFSPDFKLDQESAKKYIREKLGGNEPSVVVGVSLGGLIAPNIAKDYPRADLVLIATGPYLRTEIGPYNNLLKFVGSTKTFSPFYWGIRATPTWFYSIIYKTLNNARLTVSDKDKLEGHIKENWSCVKEIPEGEDVEIIDFITKVDNTILLRSLKNRAIIFAGDGDIMMPTRLSMEMNELIKNSELVINKEREHWSVFSESEYSELDDFLGRVK